MLASRRTPHKVLFVRYAAKGPVRIIGFASFVLVSAVCAIALRAFIRRADLAACMAAIVASALLVFWERLRVGYLDPFWPFWCFGSAILAWIVATIVIHFFDRWRGRAA